jgi:hypothetical protein
MDNVFVIGDTHGNLDRLEALLKQEGLLGRCEDCDGAGLVKADCSEPYQHEYQCTCPEVDCISCDGDGQMRLRRDVTVVHLGDLGHFGHRGSPTGDMLCYREVAKNRWCDIVLWGNHDRASIDGSHHATDYMQVPEANHYIRMLYEEGRMLTAYEAHGFLITHAGLAHAFKQQSVDAQLKADPAVLANWLNKQDSLYIEGTGLLYPKGRTLDDVPRLANRLGGSRSEWRRIIAQERFPKSDPNALAIINAIGIRRGGRTATGGILWRDIEEKLYSGFRQIFGHSADPKHQVRFVSEALHTRSPFSQVAPEQGWSYCIDIGGKGNEDGASCLAGIWLPSEKIVRVDL